jgi:hypothetical protein
MSIYSMVNAVSNKLEPSRSRPSPRYLKTYIPGGVMSMQTASWAVDSTAGVYCDTLNNDDRLVVKVKWGCNDEEIVIYNGTGTTGNDFVVELANTIRLNPNIGGLGNFVANGPNLEFTAAYPGVNIEVSFEQTGTNFTYSELTNVAGVNEMAQGFKHGQVIHTSKISFADMPTVFDQPAIKSLSNRPTALMPTQDPTLPASTEIFAGIAVDSNINERGYPKGTYPYYGDCNDNCPPVDRCVEVFCGPCYEEVDMLLEHDIDPSMTVDNLFYRIAPDGDFTDLGLFSLVAGAGLIAVPFQYKVERTNCRYLVATIHG